MVCVALDNSANSHSKLSTDLKDYVSTDLWLTVISDTFDMKIQLIAQNSKNYDLINQANRDKPWTHFIITYFIQCPISA